MPLFLRLLAIVLFALPFTWEQDGIRPPLPLGLFKFIQPAVPSAPLPTPNTAAAPATMDVVSLDVVLSSHDTAVVRDYSRRNCIGSVFNAPLGCPCASPGKRCYDVLSKCNLENRCVCDGTKGFTSADKTRCIAYTTTTRATTRTTTTSTTSTPTSTASTSTSTTAMSTTSTTTRTSTSTSTTTPTTTTTTTPSTPSTPSFVGATQACQNQYGGNLGQFSVNTVDLCDRTSLTLMASQIITIRVLNPMPTTSCTVTIDKGPGSTIAVYFQGFFLPAGGSGCSTGGITIDTSAEYCASRCPPTQNIANSNGPGVVLADAAQTHTITFRVDPTAGATVNPAVTPSFLTIQVLILP